MKFKKYIYIYFALFSIVFTILIPPFEAPDEQFHLQYINYVSKYKSLPNQYEGIEENEKYVGQGHQHPLYYLIAGSLNFMLNPDKVISTEFYSNKKHIWNGGEEGKVPLFNNVYNKVFLNNEDKILFYLMRLISTLFGLLNLFFIFKIGSLFFKDDKFVLLTGILAATLPQFIFVSSIINNDSFANLISTISLYSLLKILNNPNHLKSYCYAGVAIGLALISKKTLFFVVPVFVIILIFNIMTQAKNRKQIIINSIIFVSIVLFLSGWLFVRNIIIYGDFLATQMELDTMKPLIARKSLFSFYFISPFFPNIIRSFFGVFGWMNLPLPIYIYVYYLIFALTSFTGLLIYFTKTKLRDINSIYSLICIFSALAGIIYFNLTYTQYQGRYMLPVISLIAVILTLGLKSVISKFNHERHQYLFLKIQISLFIIIDIISVYVIYKFYYTESQYL